MTIMPIGQLYSVKMCALSVEYLVYMLQLCTAALQKYYYEGMTIFCTKSRTEISERIDDHAYSVRMHTPVLNEAERESH